MTYDDITVRGTVAPGFEGVRDAYAAVLAEDSTEPGSQLAVRMHGRTVVDLWAGEEDHFGLGFERPSVRYPSLSESALGHRGAAGAQAFADPANGLAYGYTRRRYAFPGGAAPENERLVAAVARAVEVG